MLWDGGLIRNLDQGTDILTTRLLGIPASPLVADLDVAHAAEESCKIMGMPGFYPDRKFGADYVERYTPVVEQRLATAGARLAALLNRTFR